MPREVMVGEGSSGPDGGENLAPALPIPLLPWTGTEGGDSWDISPSPSEKVPTRSHVADGETEPERGTAHRATVPRVCRHPGRGRLRVPHGSALTLSTAHFTAEGTEFPPRVPEN